MHALANQPVALLLYMLQSLLEKEHLNFILDE